MRDATAHLTNLFEQVPAGLKDEVFTTLVTSTNVTIERIVSHGHSSPPDFWYDQSQHEFVVLLTGAARLAFADEVRELKPGDFLTITPHRRHRVEWTTPDKPTVWLAIFFDGPAESPCC